MSNLAGKVIAITGGAIGIGRAAAKECARAGAKVIVADVSSEQGERLSAEIAASGGESTFVRCDVTSVDECRLLAGEAIDKYGTLTGLVTCAGVLQGASVDIDGFERGVFERVLDVNVVGIFLAVKYAEPAMEHTGGVIVCIAAHAGVIGSSSSHAYGTSRGGPRVCEDA